MWNHLFYLGISPHENISNFSFVEVLFSTNTLLGSVEDEKCRPSCQNAIGNAETGNIKITMPDASVLG